MRWLLQNWYVVLFALVNLAIAAPAEAGWKNDSCDDPDGGQYGCCTTCWFFCGCEYAENDVP